MDHIPLPSEHTHSPILVPFVVKPEHRIDGGDLRSFPARKGFELAAVNERGAYLRYKDSLQPVTFEDACSFIQSWLFFSILYKTGFDLQVPVDVNSLIQGSKATGYFVSTKTLPMTILKMALFENETGDPGTFFLYRLGLESLWDHLGLMQSLMMHSNFRGKAVYHSVELDDTQFSLASQNSPLDKLSGRNVEYTSYGEWYHKGAHACWFDSFTKRNDETIGLLPKYDCTYCERN
jgi:hypothetical protein